MAYVLIVEQVERASSLAAQVAMAGAEPSEHANVRALVQDALDDDTTPTPLSQEQRELRAALGVR